MSMFCIYALVQQDTVISLSHKTSPTPRVTFKSQEHKHCEKGQGYMAFLAEGNQPSANSRLLSRPLTERFLCVQLQLDGWG